MPKKLPMNKVIEAKLYFLNSNTVTLHIQHDSVDNPYQLNGLQYKDNVEEFLTALALIKDMPYITNNFEVTNTLNIITTNSAIKNLYTATYDIVSVQPLPFNPARGFGGCFFSTEHRGSFGYICGEMASIEKFCKQAHDLEEAVRVAKKWERSDYKVTASAQREEIDSDINFIIRGNIKKMHFIGLFATRGH